MSSSLIVKNYQPISLEELYPILVEKGLNLVVIRIIYKYYLPKFKKGDLIHNLDFNFDGKVAVLYYNRKFNIYLYNVSWKRGYMTNIQEYQMIKDKSERD